MGRFKSLFPLFLLVGLLAPAFGNACTGTVYACESEAVEYAEQALANCEDAEDVDLTIAVIQGC